MRELVRAPGATFAEALDSEGERRLLQIVRLRAVRDEAERAERREVERALARLTAALPPSYRVHAHGGTEEGDGTRIVYWALAWVEPRAPDRSRDDLAELGADLARGLAEVHAAGCGAPLLSELALAFDGGRFVPLGVPITPDPVWLFETEPGRRAPEEDRDTRPSGDLWRLGRLRSELAGSAPRADLGPVIERLALEDPGARFASAMELANTLASIAEIGGRPAIDARATTDTATTSPVEAPPLASSPTLRSGYGPSRASGSLRASLAIEDPPRDCGAHDERDLEAVRAPDEAATEVAEPLTPVPERAGPAVIVRTLDFAPPSPPPRSAPAPTEPPVDLLDDPLSAEPTDGDVEAAMAVLAASWKQPDLPAGESPWSEVVSPRGMHHRARQEFLGYDGALPHPKPAPRRRPSPVPEPAPPASGLEPAPFEVIDATEVAPEVARAITSFKPKKLVSAVLAVLIIFGVFALLSRTSPREERDLDLPVALPINEVTLDSDPSGATVLAEADRKVLGKTPLSFLVPGRVEATVYLVLEGHEPLGVRLPERGGIRAELARSGQERFEVDLPPAGAAPRPGSRTVRVTEPAGATAYLNGDPIGRVPVVAEVKDAFSRVRVDDQSGMTEERWVPTMVDVEVRMPMPKHRRLPILVVPDSPVEEDAVLDPASGATDLADEGKARASRLLASATKHLAAGRTKLARRHFLACLEADPVRAECYRGLGTLYRRIRNPRKARESYKRYLELMPAAPDAAEIQRFLGI